MIGIGIGSNKPESTSAGTPPISNGRVTTNGDQRTTTSGDNRIIST